MLLKGREIAAPKEYSFLLYYIVVYKSIDKINIQKIKSYP